MIALGGGGSMANGESDGFIGDGQLESNLERLRFAVHALLQKVAKMFPGKKRGTVFLFNNFDTICAVVREARPIFLKYDENGGGQTFSNETFKFFDEQLAAQSDAFVEEELADHFGPLIEFIKSAEALQKGAEGEEGQAPSLQQATQLMRDFADRWKGAIERIHAEVIKNFGNLQQGDGCAAADALAAAGVLHQVHGAGWRPGADGTGRRGALQGCGHKPRVHVRDQASLAVENQLTA